MPVGTPLASASADSLEALGFALAAAGDRPPPVGIGQTRTLARLAALATTRACSAMYAINPGTYTAWDYPVFLPEPGLVHAAILRPTINGAGCTLARRVPVTTRFLAALRGFRG